MIEIVILYVLNKYDSTIYRIGKIIDEKMTQIELDIQEIRAKAIDEFMKQVEVEYDNDACPGVTDWMDYKISIRDLFRIAEEMRGAE